MLYVREMKRHLKQGKHKRRFLTCDKKRENAPLKINPLDEETLETIYYLTDGTMKSTDVVIDEDINIRLNLNCDTDAVTLLKNRKAVLDMIQKDLANQEGDFQQNCIEQLHIWENEADPKTPYIGIAIWRLKKQIHLLNAD